MNIINEMTKSEILQLVIDEINRLGSAAAVARKLGVSPATISLVKNRKWTEITETVWLKMAKGLDYNTSQWELVKTTNSKMLTGLYDNAKSKCLWLAVSHRAGNGKTVTARSYVNTKANKAVFFLQCREWNRTKFLRALAKSMGLYANELQTSDTLANEIASYLLQRRSLKPLLILDEADKLTPGAIRALIPIYNDLEDQVGVVIQGTDNLERQFLAGVRWQKKGYDELFSRFGRKFISLLGATKKDCAAICKANGLADEELADRLFKECEPQQVQAGNSFHKMVTDLRKLKRLIQREQLLK